MTLAASALIPAAGHNPDLANVDPGLLQTYERIQKRFGRDLPINSGFRSPQRNFASGGAKKSQHMHGKALDIDVRELSKADRKRLIQIASEEGIGGIGVYGNAVHLDTGPRRAWGPTHKKDSIPGWARGTVGKHLYQKFEGSAGDTTLHGGGVTFDDLQKMAQEADKRLGGAEAAPAPLGSAQEATQAAPAPAGITFDQLQQMAVDADQRLGGRQVDPSVTEGAQGAFATRVGSGIDQVNAEIQSAQQPGLLERAGDWIGEKIHGNSELDVPEIEGELTRRDPFSSPVMQGLRNANPVASAFLPERDQEMEDLRRRLFMAESEADMAPILREAFPEAQFGVDGNGNQFISLDDQWYALDKSGLSMRDAQEVIKEGPLLVGGAAIGARLGLKAVGATGAGQGLARAFGSGAGTSAGDAGVQMMNVNSGSGAEFDTFRSAMAGVFGFAGEGIASGLGRLLGPLVSNARTFRGGRLTSEGRAAIERAGIDPEMVSDSFAAHFQKRIREANGASDEAARMAIADEFGVPLTRGQATGDSRQIAFEEASRNHAHGQAAANAVKGIDDRAAEQIGATTRQIADEMGARPESALAAAESTGEAVKTAAGAYRQAADDAFAVLSESGASVPGRLAIRIGDSLKRGVEMNGHIIDDATPNAAKAIQFINQRFSGGARGAVEFSRIEATRQHINRLVTAARKGANGADEVAMLEVKRGYDTWVDRLFTRSLMDGDAAILEKAKQARGAWAEWKRSFFMQRKGDDAGRAIEKMVEMDATPQEVASLLYGGVAVGEKGLSVRLAKRLQSILPDDAWNNVRAGAWLRLAEAPAGKPAMGPQMLANRIDGFLKGDGKAMSETLFTAEERALMFRLSKAVRLLVPPREATNPSRTSYGMARLVQDTFRSFASVIGFSEGGMSGGLGTMIAASVPGMVRNRVGAATIPAKQARNQAPSRGVVPAAGAGQQDGLSEAAGLR